MGMPTVGQWAEICQPGGRWLPFLITHVYDENTVSGVGFSGQPEQVGWGRPTGDFAHVTRGENNRQWRETGGAEAEVEEAPEGDDLTDISGIGEATAEWLATHEITTFADLAAIEDGDAEILADDEDAPQGVTVERLLEWRAEAATRTTG